MTIVKIILLLSAPTLYLLASVAYGQNLPLPREKPKLPDRARAVSPAQKPVIVTLPKSSESSNACLAELKAVGVAFTLPDPVTSERAGCGIPRPVQISAIKSPAGTIKLPGAPVLNCLFAKRFAVWAATVAGPMVKGTTGRTLTTINTGPGYQCRNRNRAKKGKVSEHAIGNAIDVSNFVLDGKSRLETADRSKGSAAQRRLLSALSTSACGYFTTVLGPGSNTAHESHFHFDYQKRGKGWNYRICQ
ncbi:MAG: extensin family protein [Hyphomicrobiales bacterium]